MMHVIYDGPNKVVLLDSWGRHYKNQVKEYPEKFASELVKRVNNRFRIVSTIKPKGKKRTFKNK